MHSAGVASSGKIGLILAEAQRCDACRVRAAAERHRLRHIRQYVHADDSAFFGSRGEQEAVLADGHGGDARFVCCHAAHGLQGEGVEEIDIPCTLTCRIRKVALFVAGRKRTHSLKKKGERKNKIR
jgi:hypothetical protein